MFFSQAGTARKYQENRNIKKNSFHVKFAYNNLTNLHELSFMRQNMPTSCQEKGFIYLCKTNDNPYYEKINPFSFAIFYL